MKPRWYALAIVFAVAVLACSTRRTSEQEQRGTRGNVARPLERHSGIESPSQRKNLNSITGLDSGRHAELYELEADTESKLTALVQEVGDSRTSCPQWSRLLSQRPRRERSDGWGNPFRVTCGSKDIVICSDGPDGELVQRGAEGSQRRHRTFRIVRTGSDPNVKIFGRANAAVSSQRVCSHNHVFNAVRVELGQ
jgi:hypothetical protein